MAVPKTLAAVAAAAALVMFPVSHASAARDTGTAACSLSEDASGNLVASVTGLKPGTGYADAVYAPLPGGSSPAVATGVFITGSTGSQTFILSTVAILMSEYPGETYLIFSVLHGQGSHAFTSCTFTPA